MIPLHRPWFDEKEEAAVLSVLRSGKLAGNGPECWALERELVARLGAAHVRVVSSATAALEMAMDLAGVRNREVLLPSFTFPSVANAILRAGGRPVFCEVREPDLNVDLEDAGSRVGPNTLAIVVTHYAGHPVDASGLNLMQIEDAAHALGSHLADRPCGTIGRFGCLSFHQTKNVAAGEGGALICPDEDALRAASILREKGTNRDAFVSGQVPFYSWVGPGSSHVMPELCAALVRVQLAKLDEIGSRRSAIAGRYDAALEDLEKKERLRIVRPKDAGRSSHHIYAILVEPERRADVLKHLNEAGIGAASHFVPLHASPYGRTLCGELRLPRTESLAASIVRLPIYPGLLDAEQDEVVGRLRRPLGAS